MVHFFCNDSLDTLSFIFADFKFNYLSILWLMILNIIYNLVYGLNSVFGDHNPVMVLKFFLIFDKTDMLYFLFNCAQWQHGIYRQMKGQNPLATCHHMSLTWGLQSPSCCVNSRATSLYESTYHLVFVGILYLCCELAFFTEKVYETI